MTLPLPAPVTTTRPGTVIWAPRIEWRISELVRIGHTRRDAVEIAIREATAPRTARLATPGYVAAKRGCTKRKALATA